MEDILSWGIEVIKAVQTTTCTPLTWIAMFIHHVFNSAFYVVVIGIFYWGIDTKKGAKLGSALLFSTCVNVAIKNFFQVPRPYIFDPTVSTNATETSFAFPSGHSQAAATFFPLFAGLQRSWKKWLKVLVGVCIPIIVALSRMYLGVHYPTDVIVGLGLGFIISCGVLLFWDKITFFIKKYTLRNSVKILIVALLCFALNAISMADTSYSALLFGFVSGYILLSDKGSFSAASGTIFQKVLRILLGFVIIAVVYYGLKLVFPGKESQLYKLFRFIRYGLVGFVATFLAPKLFVLLKLATPVSRSEEIETPEKNT
jgi:membrane-associated phospholipid phosphatase